MKKYDIEVEEVLRRVISQEAENIEDAINQVEEQYNDEQIVLDSSDFVEVSFNNLYSKKLDQPLNITLDFNPEEDMLVISSGKFKEKYVCDCIRDLNRTLETFVADHLEEHEIPSTEIERDSEIEPEI